jgi:hypothetical protein
MTTKRFLRRRFLNRRGFHAGAYVLASCEVDEFCSRDVAPRYTVDADLTVADCGRIVSLDFCVGTERDARNALYKVRLLRDVVDDFTDAMEAAIAEWRERQS